MEYQKLIKNNSCFIIAEAGVNHNGKLELAKKLVDAAVQAKVDCVKFQTFHAEDLANASAKTVAYQEKNTGKKQSQAEMLKKLELKDSDFKELKKYCDKKGIMFLSTPHTERAAELLNPLVSLFKIGSGDLTNLPLLEKIAKENKEIILATGMANIAEIRQALIAIRKINKKTIYLLHCTTNYPCPFEQVNLLAMNELKRIFAKKYQPLEIGYSDHSEGILVSIMAVCLGAKVIEKHFTLDKNMQGPDHKASLEPEELKQLVKAVKNVNKILGSKEKKPNKCEKIISVQVRKSIVAKRDIKKGDIIKPEAIVIKRPGTGIEPKYLKKVLGKKARKDIKRDELISWSQI